MAATLIGKGTRYVARLIETEQVVARRTRNAASDESDPWLIFRSSLPQ